MEYALVENGLPLTLTGDIIFFLILAAVGVGVGFLVGRHRLMSALVSIYLAALIVLVIPSSIMPSDPIYVFLVFCAIIITLSFLDESLFDVNAEITGKLWKSVLLGFFVAALFVSATVHLLPEEFISDFVSSRVLGYFISPWAQFGWIMAPLVFLFVLQKKWR